MATASVIWKLSGATNAISNALSAPATPVKAALTPKVSVLNVANCFHGTSRAAVYETEGKKKHQDCNREYDVECPLVLVQRQTERRFWLQMEKHQSLYAAC